jgi:hypothetical protein
VTFRSVGRDFRRCSSLLNSLDLLGFMLSSSRGLFLLLGIISFEGVCYFVVVGDNTSVLNML